MEEDPVAFLRVSDKLARLEESKSFESKKWVWIQDKKECFKAAEVKSSKGDIYVVETNDGQVYLYFAVFISVKCAVDLHDPCADPQVEVKVKYCTRLQTKHFLFYLPCFLPEYNKNCTFC